MSLESINRYLEQPKEIELPSSDPVEIARIGAERNALFLQNVFGDNHPVVLEAKEQVALTPDYVEKTAFLFDDTKRRREDYWGFGNLNKETSLVNLAYFDFHRFYYLVAIDKAVNILKNNGEYSPGGRVQLPYQFINTPQRETGSIEMEISFAGDELGYHPNGEKQAPFQALYDERVPFNYLLAQKEEEYQGWLPYITEMIAKLSNGEEIPLEGSAKEYWPNSFILSEETRNEIINLGWIVLDMRKKGFVAHPLEKQQEKGILLAETLQNRLPWLYENQWPRGVFRKWMARFEHEISHQKDNREFFVNDVKIPICAILFECRALFSEVDFFDRHPIRNDKLIDFAGQVVYFIWIMDGEQKITYLEKYYIVAIQENMKGLREAEQRRMIEALRKMS